jgi:hypothetical protein
MDQDLICGRGSDISLLQMIHTLFGIHPSSVVVLPLGYNSWGVKLTTPFHQVLSLRMHGSILTFLLMPSLCGA